MSNDPRHLERPDCTPSIRTVADIFHDVRRCGGATGSTCAGLAADEDGRTVQIALWVGTDDRVIAARWRASTCPSLIAYAETACALLEAGIAPVDLERAALRAAVAGVHPAHRRHADLVLDAVHDALAKRELSPSQP
jgi:hypothetical protein